MDAQCAEAYLGMVCLEWKCTDAGELGEKTEDITQNRNFIKAQRYASGEVKSRIQSIAEENAKAIREKEEAERRAKEEQRREKEAAQQAERAHKKKMIKITIIVAAAVLVLAVFLILLFTVIIPDSNYKKAEALLTEGNPVQAAIEFFTRNGKPILYDRA